MISTLLLAAQATTESPHLLVDPLLIRQAAEVWSIVGRAQNPVWPGWNAESTPILVYLPGKQDLLINHPNPPAGFAPYTGPVRFPGATMHIKNGPTLISFDGQNTTRDVNGIQTLVVADTLSNRRQELSSFASQAATNPDMSAAMDSFLEPRPLSSMLLFAHEAFHVYQHSRSKKGGNEMVLMNYPALSVENNVGFALESDALADALSNESPRPAAVRWLAIREERRRHLKPDEIGYEDGTEFNEGLAKYVEWRMLEELEKKTPHPEMWLIQGFSGYANVHAQRARLTNMMKAFMSGTANVNNDPYGASPVRMRLYYSGMGAGALLDRLGADWKARIMTEATLTDLVRDQIKPTPEELRAAWSEISRSERYRELVVTKTDLARRGQEHADKFLASFDLAPGSLTIDYSALKEPQIGYSFTPFGIFRIDDHRRIFHLIPVSGMIGKLTFAEDGPRPLLDDSQSKTVRLQLTAAPPNLPTGRVNASNFDLPGVKLTNVTGTFTVAGKHVTLHLVE